jgi:hypothetical protein
MASFRREASTAISPLRLGLSGSRWSSTETATPQLQALPTHVPGITIAGVDFVPSCAAKCTTQSETAHAPPKRPQEPIELARVDEPVGVGFHVGSCGEAQIASGKNTDQRAEEDAGDDRTGRVSPKLHTLDLRCNHAVHGQFVGGEAGAHTVCGLNVDLFPLQPMGRIRDTRTWVAFFTSVDELGWR